ncbi:MAG: CHAT domain-containing protein [Bacteroidetes bacterium]|nr:CHAT domain-containing protein [Bacteroidota bacterium]
MGNWNGHENDLNLARIHIDLASEIIEIERHTVFLKQAVRCNWHEKFNKYKLEDDLDSASSALYLQLFAPIDSVFSVAKINIDKIIITTDDFLAYLPFEALLKDSSKKRYLVADYEISYSYSTTLLHQQLLNLVPETKLGSFLGVAPSFTASAFNSGSERSFNPEPGAIVSSDYERYNFQPLDYTLREIEAVGTMLDKLNYENKLVTSEHADEATIKSLNLSEYNFIHFETHGFVNVENPSFSGLGLTKNQVTIEDDILSSFVLMGG